MFSNIKLVGGLLGIGILVFAGWKVHSLITEVKDLTAANKSLEATAKGMLNYIDVLKSNNKELEKIKESIAANEIPDGPTDPLFDAALDQLQSLNSNKKNQ